MRARTRRVVERIGQAGRIARGIVFATAGCFSSWPPWTPAGAGQGDRLVAARAGRDGAAAAARHPAEWRAAAR
jgi:hypothetical protein